MSYSVETRNPFELLEGGSAVKKPIAPRKKAAPAPAPVETTERPARRKGGERGGRGGRRGGRGGAVSKNEEGGERRRRDRSERGERGEGGERRRPNKREFDRRSGAGRSGAEKKRGGGGKGTWGKPGSEIEALQDGVEKVEPETPVVAEGAESPAPAEGEAAEPEAPTIGLEEFEKARQAKLAKLRAPNAPRKVEAPSDIQELSRGDTDENPFSGQRQKKKSVKRKGGRDGAVPADKVFKFEFAEERGERGGRGRGRGGRGGNRGGRSDGEGKRKGRSGRGGKAVDFSESAFPTLGGR